METSFGRARRRYLRARGQMEDRNVDSVGARNVLPEPSDDETAPAEPKGIQRTLPPHLNLPPGSQDPRLTVQMIPCPTRETSSRRSGEPSDTLSNNEQRASRDLDATSADISLADFGIPPMVRQNYSLGGEFGRSYTLQKNSDDGMADP